LFGLLNIDRGSESHAEPLELAAHGRLQLLGVDALVADRGDHRIGCSAAEDVSDPPDPKYHDQETEQALDDEGSSLGANRLEHGGKWPLLSGPRPVDPSACRCDVGPQIETGPRGRNMAVRTKLVAGNWKMNGLREDGRALACALAQRAIAA